MDMYQRYSRNLPALSRQEQELLHKKRVLVAGCGGLGGYITENLLRLGIGHITAVDGDSFDVSNLNRQLLATEATIGKSKAEAAKERAALVNPSVEFMAIGKYITPRKRRGYHRGPQYRDRRFGQRIGTASPGGCMCSSGYTADSRRSMRLVLSVWRFHARQRPAAQNILRRRSKG